VPDTFLADVCVIGSGAGGAVAAAELAEGGLRVVVLEEGPARGRSDATGRPRDTLPRLYRDGGQVATIGRPPLMLPLGRGTGGTTFVNSGTCFRTPPSVLARWREEHGIDGLSDALFERVEEAIGVAEVPPELAGRNAATIRRGAERLGWHSGYLRRNARGCRGSGVCAFGCPTGAKQHAGEVYLPRAVEAGATLVTGARAERILVRDGRAVGVAAVCDGRTTDGSAVRDGRTTDGAAARGGRRAGGGPARLTVHADTVVVAAGAVHTPLLLARSGLGSPALGRHLTVHPATAVWGVFDEPVDMSRGVPQSYYVDEFAGEGFVFEGIAGPPDYLALAAPFAGDALRELMLGHRHVAQCGLMVSDRSRGRVASVLGRPVVRYDLGAHDAATFHTGLLRLTELMWAAGARRVILPVARVPELRGGDSAPLRDLDLQPRDLKLMGFHPLGTARAHRDPAHGVVDGDLAVHGVRGVHVADGAAVPGPLGVNPQITIMALATRLAHHLLETEVPACRS
jgi:choline dehydrogenase-like flavoprotein